MTMVKEGLKYLIFFHIAKRSKYPGSKDILIHSTSLIGKKLLTDKIETMGGDKFWGLTKQGLKLVSSKIQFGHFWTNVIHIWADLQEDFTAAPETILSQPLWIMS